MTVDDLIRDLRRLINPAYADTIGTESYERRLCADALQEQQDEIERLRAELAAAAFCDARCSWVEHHPSCVFSERDALRAELDALREAMRRLFQWAYTMAGYGLEHTGDHPLAVAKTMLEAAPKPGDSA